MTATSAEETSADAVASHASHSMVCSTLQCAVYGCSGFYTLRFELNPCSGQLITSGRLDVCGIGAVGTHTTRTYHAWLLLVCLQVAS